MSADSISKEVRQFEREMRAEDLKTKIVQYKVLIAFVFLLLVGAFFGYSWYHNNKNEQIAYDAAEFIKASIKMRAHEDEEAKQIFTRLLEGGRSEYASAAGFYIAAMDVYTSKYDEAANIYDKISHNTSYRKAARDYAEYMSIMCKLQHDKDDAAAIEKLNSYLKKNPVFKYNAQELIMSIYISQENYQKAQEILSEIQSDTTIGDLLKIRAKDIGSGIERPIKDTLAEAQPS